MNQSFKQEIEHDVTSKASDPSQKDTWNNQMKQKYNQLLNGNFDLELSESTPSHNIFKFKKLELLDLRCCGFPSEYLRIFNSIVGTRPAVPFIREENSDDKIMMELTFLENLE